MRRYEIALLIDEITPCLRDSFTNAYVDTRYEKIKHISPEAASQMQKYEKWHFD